MDTVRHKDHRNTNVLASLALTALTQAEQIERTTNQELLNSEEQSGRAGAFS